MQIIIQAQSLHTAQCLIQRKASPSKLADNFPQANVVFPSNEVLCLEVDIEAETLTYCTYLSKWPANMVTALLDEHHIDYVVQ